MKRTVVNPCGEAETHHSPRLSERPVSAGSAALGTGNKEESRAREAFRVNVPGFQAPVRTRWLDVFCKRLPRMAAHVAGLGMLKAQNRVAQFIGVGPAAKLRVIKASRAKP
jgi:hypothetical protein